MNEQAKILLSAYRPGGGDASDPAFAEALAQAQRDPQLRAWLEESQRFDQTISEKLRTVAVPANLRATILAGAKMSRPRRWWEGSRVWAMAAALAILASLGALWQRKAAELDGWQTHSLAVLDDIVSEKANFDLADPRPPHLMDWLREREAPIPAALPPALAAHPSLGCKNIDSDGRNISLICFDLGNHEAAHLFTTPRKGLRIPPPDKNPAFSRLRNWNLASWSSGGDVHMLATGIDEGRLRALLPVFAAAQDAAAPLVLGEILPNP